MFVSFWSGIKQIVIHSNPPDKLTDYVIATVNDVIVDQTYFDLGRRFQRGPAAKEACRNPTWSSGADNILFISYIQCQVFPSVSAAVHCV